MKGLVFTKFLDLVDDRFGEEMTDTIISACPLKSGGAYTSVGTYPASELLQLVGALSERTDITPEALQRAYGQTLFAQFEAIDPKPFRLYRDPFTFLENVDRAIHDDVRALYPDAELPTLATERLSDDVLLFHYQSRRDLPAFCRGLIEGCLAYFRRHAAIEESVDKSLDPHRHTFKVSLV